MAFSVRRSLAWMTMSQGGLVVMQFGATLVIARLLSPYETGVFTLAAAMAGLLGMLRTLGLSNYVIRAIDTSPAFLAGVFTVNAVLSAVVAVLTVAMSVLGGALLGEPGVRDVLLVLAVIPLLACLEFLPSACIERTGNFRTVAMVNLGRNFVATAVMLTFAFAGHSYMSLAYGQVAGAVVAVVAFNAIGRRFASLAFGRHGWREIARYGLNMLAASVGALAARLSDFILGWMLGLHALGVYSRAAGLLAMIWENFSLIMGRVVFVALIEQRRRGLSFRDTYLRVLAIATALLWPTLGGLAVVSGPVLLTLYGAQWVGGALVLSLLAVGTMVSVTIILTGEVFVASDETARLARCEAVRCLFGVAGFTFGCLGGVGWAAAARIAEAALGVALYRPHLARMTDTTFADCLPELRRGAMLTVLAVAPAALVMVLNGWSPHAPLLQVLAGIATGVTFWAGGLCYLDHPLWREARRAVAQLRPNAGLGGRPK